MSRLRFEQALTDTNVKAFLRVIRDGESSQEYQAYWMRYHPSRRVQIDSLADGHPRIYETLPDGSGRKSSAAGAYQFTATTWDAVNAKYGLDDDFSPHSQDVHAVALLEDCGALKYITAGQFDKALSCAATQWASLPDSPLQDGGHKMSYVKALAVYETYGGRHSESQEQLVAVPVIESTTANDSAPAPAWPKGGEGEVPPQQEKTMAPIIPIIASALGGLLPEVAKLVLDKDKSVPERNFGIAEKVVRTVTTAVGAVNEQDALEKVQRDPAMLEKAREALRQQWYELQEAGGGGIEGARKADVEFRASGDKVWSSPSFIIACVLLPLVYAIVFSIVLKLDFLPEWTMEVRSGVAQQVLGMILGGLIGYYYGMVTSRNRPNPT